MPRASAAARSSSGLGEPAPERGLTRSNRCIE
jgi:hypothetical protein